MSVWFFILNRTRMAENGLAVTGPECQCIEQTNQPNACLVIHEHRRISGCYFQGFVVMPTWHIVPNQLMIVGIVILPKLAGARMCFLSTGNHTDYDILHTWPCHRNVILPNSHSTESAFYCLVILMNGHYTTRQLLWFITVITIFLGFTFLQNLKGVG